MRRLVIRPEVLNDLQDADEWYQQQRSHLGNEFRQAVEGKFGELCVTGHRFAVIWDDVRVAILKRFPYVILFRTTAEEVTILAVYHAHSDPQSWTLRS